MKKSLLKTALICLGVAFLCGLSSFNTPELEKSRQNCQTAAIIYDTIITQNGVEPQVVKKEIVVEGDPNDCECVVTLEIVSPVSTKWELIVTNHCNRSVIATYNRDIFTAQGQSDCYSEINNNEVELNPRERKEVASGSYDCSYCEPISVSARFK